MNNHIIITGQNKNMQHLINSLNVYKKLRSDGFIDRIIVSIWLGDYIPLFKDFEVIESPLPNFNFQKNAINGGFGQGNIWPQMVSYEKAINQITDNSLVLKTRQDLFIEESFVLKIFNTTKDEKIWIPWFEPTKPFYIADECFLGHISIMKKMYNYRYQEYRSLFQGITHVRRFIEPFLNSHPIFMEYLNNRENVLDGTLGISHNRKTETERLQTSDFYAELLATYYYVIMEHFYPLTELGKINFKEWNNGVQLFPSDGNFMHIQNNPEYSIASLIFAYDTIWLQNLFEGNLKTDILTEKIRKFLKILQSKNINESF